MRRLALPILLAGATFLAAPGSGTAQDQQEFLAAGQPAPDVVVQGATRYGVLAEPVHLSDFRGKTVVLAFFFRARSPG